MDNYFFTSSSPCQNHAHMPWRSTQSSQPQTPIHILRLKSACSATLQYFHLPPWHESHDVGINFSWNTANLNVVNISAPGFRIWPPLEPLWNRTSLQHLANIPSVPLDELYKQMITSKAPVNPFLSTDDTTGETVSVWKLFSCTGLYNSYRISYTSWVRDNFVAILFVANLTD